VLAPCWRMARDDRNSGAVTGGGAARARIRIACYQCKQTGDTRSQPTSPLTVPRASIHSCAQKLNTQSRRGRRGRSGCAACDRDRQVKSARRISEPSSQWLTAAK
jgi:hypothetical protein